MNTIPAPSLVPGWNRHIRLAVADVRESFLIWRLWTMMAGNDIQQRYRRSMLGPFWLTLSTGLLIAALGGIYSSLFDVPLQEYLPYLTIGQIFWTFMANSLIESSHSFTIADGYLKQVRVPKFAMVLRTALRNFYVLLHNLVILILVWLVFMPPVNANIAYAVPGLLVIFVGCTAAGTVLAVICTRFRDMPQIIVSMMQLFYFITPVMWRVDQLPEDKRWLAEFNPFASYIDLIRDPLLGIAPPPQSWLTAGGITAAAIIIAFIFFARFRSRITYWL